MECYKEEIFGPVLVCMSVDTLDDAISVSLTLVFTVIDSNPNY